MPMPDLDPARFVQAVLSDPTHRVPMPDKGGRLFSQDMKAPEVVDIFDPFYAGLLADGSIRRACLVASAPALEVVQAADAKSGASEGEPVEPVDPPKPAGPDALASGAPAGEAPAGGTTAAGDTKPAADGPQPPVGGDKPAA